MLRLTARAKINWTLDILGRRADGYHQMDMLLSAVELADTLCLEPADELTLSIAGGGGLAADDDNLVCKAARALRPYTRGNPGARMRLEKRIPMGAGMGGGSADAAAALAGLNQIWGLRLPMDALLEIALTLGADVPFVLQGGLARVGGVGERLAPLAPAPTYDLVIVQPCEGLSTRDVFAGYDALPPQKHPDTDAAQRALLTGDRALLAASVGNVLTAVSQSKRPAIGEAIEALLAEGAQLAQMTGSGSAVYGLFADPSAASGACAALARRWPVCVRTRTSSYGVSLTD